MHIDLIQLYTNPRAIYGLSSEKDNEAHVEYLKDLTSVIPTYAMEKGTRRCTY